MLPESPRWRAELGSPSSSAALGFPTERHSEGAVGAAAGAGAGRRRLAPRLEPDVGFPPPSAEDFSWRRRSSLPAWSAPQMEAATRPELSRLDVGMANASADDTALTERGAAPTMPGASETGRREGAAGSMPPLRISAEMESHRGRMWESPSGEWTSQPEVFTRPASLGRGKRLRLVSADGVRETR